MNREDAGERGVFYAECESCGAVGLRYYTSLHELQRTYAQAGITTEAPDGIPDGADFVECPSCESLDVARIDFGEIPDDLVKVEIDRREESE